MRAVRLLQLGKPLEDAEVALPEIGPSEVLVRVAACGICHSDAHFRENISPIDPLPMTLGHEVAGRVETVGEEVDHVSPGDRIYVHYLVSCRRHSRLWWIGIFSFAAGKSLRLPRDICRRYQPDQTRLNRGVWRHGGRCDCGRSRPTDSRSNGWEGGGCLDRIGGLGNYNGAS